MENAPVVTPDPIFDVELAIARRADRLAAERSGMDGDDRQCWLRAEVEILGFIATEGATTAA